MGGWAYCSPPPPPSAVSVGVSSPADCKCVDVWTDTDSNAACVDIEGCPTTACDGDSKSWCLIENNGCAQEEADGGWAYCSPPPPPSAVSVGVSSPADCKCVDVWTDTDSNAACVDIEGCPTTACDGDSKSW